MRHQPLVVYKAPSLCTLLLVLFITLKLCGVIAWSWWWVFAPLWLPIAGIGLFVLVIGGISAMVTLLNSD